MKITSIVQQQGRKDRFSVHVDDEYRFSLSQNQLTDSGLRTGDELTIDQLNQLMQQSELGKALDKAYHFLSYRSRSRHEVAVHLRGKHYDSDMVDQVIDQLEVQDLLSDLRFAGEWIANRQLLDPRSRMELKAELRQKGIGSAVVEEALATVSAGDELEALETLIAKKNLRRRYPDERKLWHYLSTKGYSPHTIRGAIKTDESD
ncbi:MAG TPA: RecX family transcriptional regulator [Candidatus Polarisedimenticolaceae bacterium]|nr:RecX family transcriptional regulator [Candidatus Polarisedimenticolaceae bacterium]